MKIITQIYGIRSIRDAKIVLGEGVDHIGVGLRRKRAREIFDFIDNKAVKVGLIKDSHLNEIYEMLEILMPDILHLSGDIEDLSPNDIEKIKERVPKLKIMQALPANDPRVFKYVKEYEGVSDFFIIDTVAKDINPGIGGTGLTHDLEIDKKIIEMTNVKCIIAGGLGPENVVHAIQKVHPYGVDSLTKTSYDKSSGLQGKDPIKVKAFVNAVREIEKL